MRFDSVRTMLLICSRLEDMLAGNLIGKVLMDVLDIWKKGESRDEEPKNMLGERTRRIGREVYPELVLR